MLHVTSGDIAANLIRDAGLPGRVLPWRDVLHEGPLPHGLGLEAMSEVRARELGERDQGLRAGLTDDEIVLWFEADLYDQLQVVQILDFIGQQDHPTVSIICIGNFPGVPGFQGLGQLTSGQLASLFPRRRAVQNPGLELARLAWSAITAPTPEPLNQLCAADTALLEFLGPALIRLLEHNRTESQILRVIEEGNRSFEAIFPAVFTSPRKTPGDGILLLAESGIALVHATDDFLPRRNQAEGGDLSHGFSGSTNDIPRSSSSRSRKVHLRIT